VGGAYLSGLRSAGMVDRYRVDGNKLSNVRECVEHFPFVAMATTLAKERERVSMEQRPFAYQIETDKQRTDIARMYSRYQSSSVAHRSDAYEQAVYDTNQIVHCDEREMEQERKALLSGIFEEGCSAAMTPKKRESSNSSSNGKKMKKEVTVDLTLKMNSKKNMTDLTVDSESAKVPVLPSIKSLIDKQVQNENESLVEMIGAEERAKAKALKEAENKKRASHKRRKSKERERERQKAKERRSRKRESAKSKRKTSSSTVDLTEESEKISGMSSEAKALLKEGKDKIGLFARKHLAKQLKANNAQCAKEEFKLIAKKVTAKVFDDFRKRFKHDRSLKSLDYDAFMAAKRKRKVEGLIKAYVKRDVTERQQPKKKGKPIK